MAIEYVNGFYMSGNTAIGNYYGSVNDKQLHNASHFVPYFLQKGWHLGAICGMLGNMQIESSMNPALIEGNGRQYAPDNASVLTSMTNSVMLNFYKEAHPEYTGSGNPFGLGIVQWTGHNASGSVPYGQKYVAFAISECDNTPWYYGQNQMARIYWESLNNAQWDSKRIDGVDYYWDNFITLDNPLTAAHVWMVCYERPVFTDISLERRKENAHRYYVYFESHPVMTIPKFLSTIARKKDRKCKIVIYHH